MRRPTYALLLAASVTACGGGGGSSADASAPVADADPNAPDAGPENPDATVPEQCSSTPVSGVPTLDLETVVEGLTAPTAAVVPPGESRIFVLEKHGYVDIVENGQVKQPRFLDMTSLVLEDYNERGLLGIAFHPDYQTNKRFYVYYTAKPSGNLTIAQYTASSADDGNASSGKVLLSVPHPSYKNHNGGWMAFGPDKKLYATMGDGGSGGDPNRHGQDTTQLLGKMLRLDVDTADMLKIPDGNPFKGNQDGNKEEIWAYGLRNPWRCSFDRKTGDLFIGDVGQDAVEEIDVQPAHAAGGANYGWSCREGNQGYNADQCDAQASMIKPIYTYSHSDFSDGHASVTGGYVYRGCKMPELEGTYFFADVQHGKFRSLKWNGSDGIVSGSYKEYADIQVAPYSFGEDKDGELLICDAGGTVYRLIPKP